MRAGIIGATGYTGVELVKIIARHSHLELSVITSESYAGKPFSEIYPLMQGVCDMILVENDLEEVSKKQMFFSYVFHIKQLWNQQNFYMKKVKLL